MLARHEQGVLAKNKDLVKAFGTDNQLEACRIILEKGEMQVRGLGRTERGGREINERYGTNTKKNIQTRTNGQGDNRCTSGNAEFVVDIPILWQIRRQ